MVLGLTIGGALEKRERQYGVRPIKVIVVSSELQEGWQVTSASFCDDRHAQALALGLSDLIDQDRRIRPIRRRRRCRGFAPVGSKNDLSSRSNISQPQALVNCFSFGSLDGHHKLLVEPSKSLL